MKHTIEDVKTVNPEFRMMSNRIGLFNSHFQNFKLYGIPKAQLILTDIPYNIGANAYGSNPMWYVGGDNKNGESELAGEEFFDTDKDLFDRTCKEVWTEQLHKSGIQKELLCSGPESEHAASRELRVRANPLSG